MARSELTYLTPERALIFRVTHVANLPWILENGLVCQSSPVKNPNFRSIGNNDVISKRQNCVVPIPPGGRLADYVPFYFTPLSVMMLNIVTGYRGIEKLSAGELIILATSLQAVEGAGRRFVFTDSHALLGTARFSSALADLPAMIDWKSLRMRDFSHDPEDPGKKERYQAEALVHGSLPANALTGLACSSASRLEQIEAQTRSAGLELKLIARPEWFFV